MLSTRIALYAVMNLIRLACIGLGAQAAIGNL